MNEWILAHQDSLFQAQHSLNILRQLQKKIQARIEFAVLTIQFLNISKIIHH